MDSRVNKSNQYGDCIRIGNPSDLNAADFSRLTIEAKSLAPWRKGPFELHGLRIDGQWDSSLKWKRALAVADSQGGLKGRRVCDVGCNNGYYLFRAIEAGATSALGLDPAVNFEKQFEFITRDLGDSRISFKRAGYQWLLEEKQVFDVIFCMGVVYHQKNPYELLDALRESLAPGGYVVLETLGADLGERMIVPAGKYAGQGGIWMVPGPVAIQNMLRRSGFGTNRMMDVWDARDEQSRTEFADLPCMKEFYNDTGDKTIEGYEVPLRYLFLAKR
ncbi:MAG: tRNA 5-methoxyuridine(34)/uridine 5-oxyacetic acid(34) synthase CmoB [Spirochaetia bacterium]|nr:tRNA 5-methoxyuridine(34)/uridine 5-oxyacetic acid(34) synthase CmoB [Spirochaetia bacterium]